MYCPKCGYPQEPKYCQDCGGLIHPHSTCQWGMNTTPFQTEN